MRRIAEGSSPPIDESARSGAAGKNPVGAEVAGQSVGCSVWTPCIPRQLAPARNSSLSWTSTSVESLSPPANERDFHLHVVDSIPPA